MSNFDNCFHSYPDWEDLPDDWPEFWKSSLAKLKKVPLELRSEGGKSLFFGENITKLTYQGIDKYQLHATLYFPKRLRGKPPVIVVFPDYNAPEKFYPEFVDERYAVFIVQLRGHTVSQKEAVKTSGSDTPESYGYFAENLREKEDYYMRSLYLDAYRSLEVLRLNDDVDRSRIYLYGTGTGAAMALFVEYFMPRASALVLDRPAFANLPVTQNLSQADYANEINSYLRLNRAQKSAVKQTLGYFDAAFFTQKIKAPVAMTVFLEDKENIPHGAFSIFHGLNCEKTMEVFPDSTGMAELEKKKISKVVSFYKEY